MSVTTRVPVTVVRPERLTAHPVSTREQLLIARQGAVANGLEVFSAESGRVWAVTSATDPRRVHIVLDNRTVPDELKFRCDCDHGKAGRVCEHTAAVAVAVGAVTPNPDPTPMVCPICGGAGFTRMCTGGRLSDWWAVPCRQCRPKRVA